MSHVTNEMRLKKMAAEEPLVTGDEKIAIFGANGQIGKKLRPVLEKIYPGKVKYYDYFTDDKPDAPNAKTKEQKAAAANCEICNITDEAQVESTLKKDNVKVVVNLAAFLSAAAEKFPEAAYAVNVEAPLGLLKIAKKLGLKRVQMMSSMASQEFDRVQFDSAEEYAMKQHLQENSSSSVMASPMGLYALQKRLLENAAQMYSVHYGLDTNIPCLAGVLNADTQRIADGTTEQVDEAVVSAARQKVYAERGLPCPGLVDGYHIPAVSKETKFAMVDGETLPEAVLMLLHKNLLPNKGIATPVVHNVYEYTVSMEEVERILKQPGLNPDFKIKWPAENDYPKDGEQWKPGQLDRGKMSRAASWAIRMNTHSTQQLTGGFQRHTNAESSITSAFNRAYTEISAQLDKEQGIKTTGQSTARGAA